MRIIGLTGGIACGKSIVSRFLSDAGCFVVDGDLLARKLTGPGGPAVPSIRQRFGAAYLSADGSMNRRAMGDLVFSDEAARAELDRIMAPFLQSATEEQIGEARRSGAELCVLDMPLLYEKGYDHYCDTVWCVWLPRDLQLARLMQRDGCSEAQAGQKIAASLPVDEKADRADVVIDNSGPVDETLDRVSSLLNAEKQIAARRQRRSDRYRTDETPAVPSARAAELSPDVPAPKPERIRRSQEDGAPANRNEEPAGRPVVMERPKSARRKPSERKVAWKLPAWLLVTLSVTAFLLLAAFTAHCLMGAYLRRQAETHQEEQLAIDRNYPYDYRELIETSAEEFNLNPAFVTAIIRNESSFRPSAESSVGARGLMQLMPDTAEWIAQKLKVDGYAFDRMYDPASNIRFGCWYLNYLNSLFRGDPVCVACAYHAGQGEVVSWLSNSAYSDDGVTLRLDSLLDGPTKAYAGRVIRDYGIYQEKYYAVPAVPADDGSAGSPAD